MSDKSFFLFFLFLIIGLNNGYTQKDSIITDSLVVTSNNDSLVKKGKKRYKPYYDTITHHFKLRNEEAKFGKKFLRGSLINLSYNSAIASLLLILPEDISKWNKSNYGNQFKKSFTHAPVVDKDKWYINYIGHPYQGTFYYNLIRSQGAKIWQSSLFCLGSVWIWEYTIEAGFEQPSIQDLVVTPAAGILLGELFHFSTIKMSKNGFKWYEKMFVSIFNPTFAINNGFKYANRPKINTTIPYTF